MGETKHHYTYEDVFIFILCYLESDRCDWDIFYKAARHHSPDFVPSEALGTIKFTKCLSGGRNPISFLVIAVVQIMLTYLWKNCTKNGENMENESQG